jgi:uncharacterized protein YaeQ
MALPSTLYRFRIDLSDVDRNHYKEIDLRTAMHPSEAAPYLLTRVLAYALNEDEGLEFTPGGLSDPDAPCMSQSGPHGSIKLWIEIGNPSARKLHRAAKAAETVKVYTYKDPDALLKEIRTNKVHNVDEIGIFSLDPQFLDRLARSLGRDNKWTLVRSDGTITVTVQDKTEQTELRRHGA